MQIQNDSWKNFESTGSVQEYLRYKQQQAVMQKESPLESEYADCNTGFGSAGSENR